MRLYHAMEKLACQQMGHGPVEMRMSAYEVYLVCHVPFQRHACAVMTNNIFYIIQADREYGMGGHRPSLACRHGTGDTL